MSNNRKQTGGGSTRSKSATSKTISIRVSLRDLDTLRRRAEARGLTVGHYARLVLIDDIRPVTGERSLAALAALLRAASMAAEGGENRILALELRQLCQNALRQIQDDRT